MVKLDFFKKKDNTSDLPDNDGRQEIKDWKAILDKSPNEEELLDALKRKKDDAREERRIYEPQWVINKAFLSGNHWANWNYRTGEVTTADDLRTRIVVNRVRSLVKNRIAKLTRNRPKLTAVPPDSGDPSDVDAAKTAELFLEFHNRKIKLRETIQDCLVFEALHGKSFLYVYFDKNAGDIKRATADVIKKAVKENEDGEPVEEIIYQGPWPVDEDDKPIRFDEVDTPYELTDEDWKKQKVYHEGEVLVDCVPITSIYWEPGAKKLDDCKWIIRHELVNIAEIVSNPDFKNTEKVVPDVDSDEIYASEAEIGVGFYKSWKNKRSLDKGNKNMVSLYNFFLRPSIDHPDGLHIIFTKDTILYRGELPGGKFPFVEIKTINEPNRFCPPSLVEELSPINFAYNITRSQIIEYVKQLVVGVWAMRKNSLETKPTGYAGEIIEYLTEPPTRMPMDQLPGSVFNSLEVDKDDLAEISGMYEASRGIATSEIKSGIHARLLQEADDSKLGPAVDIIESAYEQVGNLILHLAREFYDGERFIKIVGENREVQVGRFKASDLWADIVVIPGSALASSKVLRQEDVFVKWQSGFYGAPNDPKVLRYVHKLMDEGLSTPENKVVKHEENNAKEENDLLLSGVNVNINPWDDHLVHDEIHLESLVSAEGKKATPEARELLWNHIQAHREANFRKYHPMEAERILGPKRGPVGLSGEQLPPGGMEPPPENTVVGSVPPIVKNPPPSLDENVSKDYDLFRPTSADESNPDQGAISQRPRFVRLGDLM